MEKYYDQNIKNIYKLFISIVNEGQKEIGGNSHVEKYYETLTNWFKHADNRQQEKKYYSHIGLQVIVWFVDIGGIVDHHCLNFLFIMSYIWFLCF